MNSNNNSSYEKNQRWISIGTSVGITSVIVILLTAFSVNLLDEYGLVLFMFVPFLLGSISSFAYSYFEKRTLKQYVKISFLTLLVSCGLLILIRIEGIVCVIMASPVVSLFVFLGALIAYLTRGASKRKTTALLSVNILLVPLLMSLESQISSDENGLIEVRTSKIINASKEEVWKQVIAFPEIPEPTEILFKTGVAYPISSRIEGDSVGAVRYCEFTTGAFVEPITVWDAPNHLQFQVEEQPVPLKEFIERRVPENMYKYFVSTKGEFRLTGLEDGRTKLEGTTWYYHKIKPVGYWKLWSTFIIHSIHGRVLNHIKNVSENGK